MQCERDEGRDQDLEIKNCFVVKHLESLLAGFLLARGGEGVDGEEIVRCPRNRLRLMMI